MAVVAPAAVLCGLNLLKPLVMDDSAYSLLAAHIAHSPFDPYGFELYWYEHPQPAFTVLAPPVLPYWWAASIRWFSDQPWIAKLWLAPWCFVLSAATFSLARRFSPSIAVAATWFVVLSPSILPSLNLMLDVPALALSLAALAVFFRDGWSAAAFAGVLSGLAMQTKYSGFLAPVAIVAAAATGDASRRQLARALVAAAIAAALFAVWELFMAAQYGQSHFMYHSTHQPTGWLRRDGLISPLIGLMGSVAAPLVILRMAIRGRSWLSLSIISVLIMAGLLLISVWPRTEGTLWTPTAVVFGLLGVGVTISMLGSLLDHLRNAFLRWESRFLVSWLAIELLGYFALSPWPAVRRVIGVTVASTFVFSGNAPITVDHRKIWFAVFCSVALATFYQAIEIENGFVEQNAVAAVDRRIRQTGPAPLVRYVGHRGWQYYAERAGWRAWDLREPSAISPGTWLIVPDSEFVGHRVDLPANAVLVDSLTFHSYWKLGTIPWFYGTNAALRRREGPVLRVDVYRVR